MKQVLYNIQNAKEMLEKYLKKVLLESALDGPITASTKKRVNILLGEVG